MPFFKIKFSIPAFMYLMQNSTSFSAVPIDQESPQELFFKKKFTWKWNLGVWEPMSFEIIPS
jgi:hypothetical protein